jgi:hypothetical protein
MSPLRRQPPPQPQRTPHPDSRVEAELQRVLSIQRAIGRIERRIEDIRVQRLILEELAARRYNGGSTHIADELARQSGILREERDALEAELPLMHDEIAKRLAELGDDALALYEMPS